MSRKTISCPGTSVALIAIVKTTFMLGCATLNPLPPPPYQSNPGLPSQARTAPPSNATAKTGTSGRVREKSWFFSFLNSDDELPQQANNPPIQQVAYANQPASKHPERLPGPELNPAYSQQQDPTHQRQDKFQAHRAPQQSSSGQTHTIDLSQALAMGGANHLQIQLARERVVEAHANLSLARSMWLPSLRFGIGWNRHDGRIQDTAGTVLNLDRNSLFVGGGAGLGKAPLAAGSGGLPRMFVNLSLADSIFEPRVAQRKLAANYAGESATMNKSLKQIATAYLDLVEAHSNWANANMGLKLANEMVQLTELFAREGAGNEAAVDLAKTEEAIWRQQLQDSRRQNFAHSAELARLLRLDPRVELVPADVNMVPVHLIDPSTPIEELMSWGMSSRPELSQAAALTASSFERMRQEKWRPLLPNVQVGASAGSFGGGPSTGFDNQGGRSDVEALAFWEVENLGLGTMGARRQTASQLRQAEFQSQWIRERVAAQIVTASSDVNNYGQQIESAIKSVKTAGQSYQRNFDRVRAGEGLPIELLQAIRSRTQALDAYTKVVANYNRTQVRLLHAIGRPPLSQ